MPEPVHPSLDTAFLEYLADSLGGAIADNGGGVLVHVSTDPDGPSVGILPLDGFPPANLLLGAVAPEDWAVLGVATMGWARPRGRHRPAGSAFGRVRAEVVVLVARDGRVVSRVRQGDRVFTEPPAYGATLDCLQRALGLPTAPPAADGEPALDWSRLRQLVAGGAWPELGLTPEEAAWFDDGAFSRWLLGECHPLPAKVRRAMGVDRSPHR
ncbi:MAG: hypothetical protein ACR2KK_04935 [Acidimicrobiales bacterium]